MHYSTQAIQIQTLVKIFHHSQTQNDVPPIELQWAEINQWLKSDHKNIVHIYPAFVFTEDGYRTHHWCQLDTITRTLLSQCIWNGSTDLLDPRAPIKKHKPYMILDNYLAVM